MTLLPTRQSVETELSTKESNRAGRSSHLSGRPPNNSLEPTSPAHSRRWREQALAGQAARLEAVGRHELSARIGSSAAPDARLALGCVLHADSLCCSFGQKE
jgi:hypothetical protein